MKRVLLALGILFVFFNALHAQKKWHQQKNSEFGDYIKVDGTPGSEMRESSGVFLDFNNDGLKDFVTPTYYDVSGSPDVFVLRFFKNMGNKVGIMVGIIPNLNSPPINPFSCSTMSFIRPASLTIFLA